MANDIGYGQFTPFDQSTELGVITGIVRRMMARMSTMKPVLVQKVTGGGGALAAAGTVDVLPLVNQLDGNGNPVKHGTVRGIPWWRLQGGSGAVICDPKVGDIGAVLCADRDISNVVKTKKQANPGSFRKFDLADGIYVGGILNAQPTQFLRFVDAGGFDLEDSLGNKVVGSSSGLDVTPASGQPVTVHGPLLADSLALGGTHAISRIVESSSFTQSGTVAAFGTFSFTITATGAQSGDFVIPGLTSHTGVTRASFVAGADQVTCTLANAGNAAAAYVIAGKCMVLGP